LQEAAPVHVPLGNCEFIGLNELHGGLGGTPSTSLRHSRQASGSDAGKPIRLSRAPSSAGHTRRLRALNAFRHGHPSTCRNHPQIFRKTQKLETLNLSFTRLGTADIGHLASGLTGLKHLHLTPLWGKRPDLATLESALSRLAERRELHVHLTYMDAESLSQLQAALPNLRISND
jgi:hypothetical protein